jgi:hypothetical protein
MVSAIYLAEKLNMNIEHLWIGTPYRCAYGQHIQYIHDKSFEYFFKPSIKCCDYIKMSAHVNRVYTEWMPSTRPNAWYNFQSYGQKLLQPTILSKLDLVHEEMDASENFLIETTYINNLKITKADKHQIYSKYFVPKDDFLNKIGQIDANTVGISIENGDYNIEEGKIGKWLSTIDNPVILFSDDEKLAEKLRPHLKKSVEPIFESMSQNDNLFLQFLLLSKCSKVYGTNSSSFCEEAANFGDTTYIPLTNDFFEVLQG